MTQSVGKAFIEHARYKLREDYLPKIVDCLRRMDDAQIWWRPNESCNSAGNLALHLCGNIRQWIIHGLGGEEDRRKRSSEFEERGPVPADDLILMVQSTLAHVDRVLADFDPDRLLEPRVIQGYEVDALKAILHVVEHFGQHLGQIIYLAKTQLDTDLRYYQLDADGRRGADRHFGNP